MDTKLFWNTFVPTFLGGLAVLGIVAVSATVSFMVLVDESSSKRKQYRPLAETESASAVFSFRDVHGCTEGEVFDEDTKECTSFCEGDACREMLLKNIFGEEISKDTHQGEDMFGVFSAPGALVRYETKDGDLSFDSVHYGTAYTQYEQSIQYDSNLHQSLWDTLTVDFEPALTTRIGGVDFFYNTQNSMRGFVKEDTEHMNKWRVGVNLASFVEAEKEAKQ